MKKNNILTGCLCALGCETLYGLSYMFTKQATDLASPFALLGWRFLIAFAAMSAMVMCGVMKIDLKRKKIKPLLAVALFCPCIYFVAETVGISQTTASESGAFLACIPVVSLAASALILHKKPAKRQVAGILVTLAGVIVTVFAVGTSSSLSLAGYVCLLGAVLSYALYCVFVDKASDFTGAEVTYVMLAAGAAMFVTLALAEALLGGRVAELVTLPFREGTFLRAILYQGIGCSVLAFFLSNVAIARIGVNRTSSFIGVATVVSIAAGALLLKESFTAAQMAGAAVIMAGVYIANK